MKNNKELLNVYVSTKPGAVHRAVIPSGGNRQTAVERRLDAAGLLGFRWTCRGRWWAGRLAFSMRRPRHVAVVRARQIFLSSEELGESPLLPSLAILGAAALYATLPSRFIAGPSSGIFSVARWVVPGLTVLMLIALVASAPMAVSCKRSASTSRRCTSDGGSLFSL